MNALTLRISGGGIKSKNSISFDPVVIKNWKPEITDEKCESFDKFIKSSNADEQLSILRKILEQNKNSCDQVTISFLVAVFLQADAKHPAKCLVTRHITRHSQLAEPFTEALALQIHILIVDKKENYRDYIDVVSKLATCIENFPAGAATFKMAEVQLAEYFKDCLVCCDQVIHISQIPSPTEKNEVFSLTHLTLRLLLHITQKISSEDASQLYPIFEQVRVVVYNFLIDEDVPMDTKSVCGLLYLCMHVVEFGADTWINILEPPEPMLELRDILRHGAAQLTFYSAIATVMPMDKLESRMVANEPAIIKLVNKILEIADRSSSDSPCILAVARSLLQISKSVHKISNVCLGLRLVDRLLHFVWPYLDHYLDSVRHITAQLSNCVVKYCSGLLKDGEISSLSCLMTPLASLDRTRKSFYVCVTSLTTELGALSVMNTFPDLIMELIAALGVQPVQASAAISLEVLLKKHITETDAETIHGKWVRPIVEYVASNTLDSGIINVLENLLAKAIKQEGRIVDYILPYIRDSCTPNERRDVKCVLMLLSVVQKSGVTSKLQIQSHDGQWKGIIGYDVLNMAAVDAVEETRTLSLSLIVESPKSTELFTPGDLSFILRYLKYNMNVQSPNFRQLTLSILKKFMKRLEDGYKVLKRQKDPGDASKIAYYMEFVTVLRQKCFDSLMPGANYSRRCIALQMLLWCELLNLDGYEREWTPEYVDTLLRHLDDSYENLKVLSLEILYKCPDDVIRNSKAQDMELEDILKLTSSLKPTDSVSAGYRLRFLVKRLPDKALQGSIECYTAGAKLPTRLCVLARLVQEARLQWQVCTTSVVFAAARAPLYPAIHCMRHLLDLVDPKEIADDEHWQDLIEVVIASCFQFNYAVSKVVNHSSPEGHLPVELSGVMELTDKGNSGGVRLQDGRQVTAQMVLLCCWRSVKEACLLLGAIVSRFTIIGEISDSSRDPALPPIGTLDPDQLYLMSRHFTDLLSSVKHRGAFEQAYVGYSKLLERLWRCRQTKLNNIPFSLTQDLLKAMSLPADRSELSPTRRSAGLPFMIQALATTEVQVESNPRCFQHCMQCLLGLAGARTTLVEVRTHCLNVLRALYRHAALHDAVAPYVGAGLVLAVNGFDGDEWMERNSATLMLSALVVRVFGVARSRDSDTLCVRNKMTGRIFFLRYPMLYDFMLAKLQEAILSLEERLHPSLYPILLILARLYPSSLEGTVSNLKLVAFIPHVLACAKSSILKTRQLAAKAMVPLISPEQYLSHIQYMMVLISDVSIRRNYCHGILLQLIRLLDARPKTLPIDQMADELRTAFGNTQWILKQAVKGGCYILADEYVKMVNLLMLRFPTLLQNDTIVQIGMYLQELIFTSNVPRLTVGRELTLANCIHLLIIITTKRTGDICQLICQGLEHPCYEVKLAVLNYLLLLHSDYSVENHFQEHLSLVADKNVLEILRKQQRYIDGLCKMLDDKYLECKLKSLHVLIYHKETQKFIVETKTGLKDPSDEKIIENLFDFIDNASSTCVHLYLKSLCDFVAAMLAESRVCEAKMVEVVRAVFEGCLSENSEETRIVTAEFLEKNVKALLALDTVFGEKEKFEYRTTLYASIIMLLEDDEENIRQIATRTIATIMSNDRLPEAVISTLAGERFRDYIAVTCGGQDGIALFSILALMDFRSEVLLTDISDECRVFDQNERYNINLEETVWTTACADKIIAFYNQARLQSQTHPDLTNLVFSLTAHPLYRETFEKLCEQNLTVFKNLFANNPEFKKDIINPKVDIFISKLKKLTTDLA